jgi:hypothetical protein
MPDTVLKDDYQVRDAFLQEEILLMEEGLPREFVGDGPVCLSVFQPSPSGGHLVFLDRDSEDRVRMSPGLNAHKSFLDADIGAVSGEVVKAPATKETIAYYIENNSESVRRDVYAIYKRRFYPRIDILEDGHVPVGTSYLLCYFALILTIQTIRIAETYRA